MTDSTSKKKRSPSKTAGAGSPPPFELRDSPIQGRGAFATRRIRKGARITEYLGEHISQEEADQRYDDEAMDRHHTFLFNLDDDTVVDGAVNGNDARFINHSCDPNCQAFIEEDRIFIYALRDIAPDDELCYDYAYERTEGMDEDSEALYVCRCGAENCRGTILAPPKPPGKPRAVKKAAKRTQKRKAQEPSSRNPTKGPRRQRSPGKGSGGRKRA
jgi:uncharacterized protein